MDAQLRLETKMVRSDDIKRLLEVKDFNKTRVRRDSVGSDASDRSDLSTKSMPQYSSYRTLSGGLLGPFENPTARPGSRGGFLPWTSNKTSMSSKLRPPGSKLKEPARPRGDGEGSSRPPSRGPSRPISPSGASTPRRPSISRESSQSRLPVFKRETSLPQITRDSCLTVPDIRREKSEIKPKKTPVPATPRGTSKAIITETTPKTVAQRIVADRNIAAKGTRSGISGVSDKIMIGDKVLITASNKVGMVQFVGETKFAKGIWAGVVLEDSTGKNDGSVAGVRYFTCPSLRGVFVKEEKLEKIAGVNTPGSTKNGDKTPFRTPKTQTSVNRNESALSIDSGVEEEQDLNVGDQVYITSANATRIGFLRYIGLTEFAKGTWCGVELQDPNGKNDGAVAGTRYFQCEPKHGIFAQIHKVKKYRSCSSSDSSGPLSPPTPKIEYAKTVTSPPTQSEEELSLNALEEVLRDEIDASAEKTPTPPVIPNGTAHETEVSLHVDVIEEENRKEIRRKTSSTEKMIHDNQENTIRLQGIVSSLEKEKMNLENEIGDCKHKIEDLQFQLEEQMMISDEMSKGPGDESEKVHGLESKLAAQAEEISKIQSEIEELRKQHEEDIFLLNEKDTQLQSRDEAISKYEQAVNMSKENENKFTAEANELKIQVQEIKELKENINSLELQNNQMKSEYNNNLSEKESTIFSLEENLVELENKLSSLSGEIVEKTAVITQLKDQIGKKTSDLEERHVKEEELIQNIKELNNQIHIKQADITSISSTNEALQNETLELKASLEVLEARNKQLNESNSKLEEDILTSSKNSGDSAQQLTHLNEQLQTKNREINSLKGQESILMAENNKLVQQFDDYKERFVKETSSLQKEKEDEIRKLQDSFNKLEENFKKVKESNEEMENKVHQLEMELKQSNDEVVRLSKSNKSKDEELANVGSELEDYKLQVTTLKNVQENLQTSTNEIVNLTDSNKSKEERISQLGLELEELKKQLLNLSSEKEVTTESTQKELYQKNNDLEVLRLENTELRTINNTLTETKNTISEKLATVESEKQCLTETLIVMKAEKDEILQEKDNVSNKHEDIKEKTDQIYKERDKLEKENINLEKEKKEVENKYLMATQELEASLSTARRHEEETTIAKKEKTESSNAMEQMHGELVAVRKELEELKVHFCSMEEENRKLNDKKLEVADRRKSLEEKVAVFNKMEAEMGAENARLQEKLKQTIEREATTRLTKETECANLQIQVKEFISRITVLENNNSLLQFELDELQQKNSVLMSTQNKKISKKSVASTEHELIKEEVENLKFLNTEKEQEVEFLNSIIVELQKKNKEQKDKIDILSYGDDVHELNVTLNDTTSPVKVNMRMRMFCDICDLFDLHDTEDCPQQSNDFGGSQHHGKRGQERPYCVICETFGHTAETCDEEEMF